MVTITTTAAEDKEKTSNCVTPKKKAANNTSAAASTTEATTEQTAPNILVYKKVRARSAPDSEMLKDFLSLRRWKRSWSGCRRRTAE